MRGTAMADWRLLQIVLDSKGVHEVEYDLDSDNKLRCTCGRHFTCKHRKHVAKQMKLHGNRIAFTVPEDTDLNEAMRDAATHRALVIQHARVEVLP